MAAILLIAAVSGCLNRTPTVRFTAADTVSQTTDVGTAPMFAVSPAGIEAVAWISAPGGGTDGRLYVSVAGATPVELRDTLGPIEAHGESPPKLVYGPGGTLAALYVVARVAPGERFPIAALRFTRSTDGGHTWSTPVTVTDDRTLGQHNFHALHAAADGSFYVAWLDGREGKSAAYLTRSTDGGRTWEANRRVATGEACPLPRRARDCIGRHGLRRVAPGARRQHPGHRRGEIHRSWTHLDRARPRARRQLGIRGMPARGTGAAGGRPKSPARRVVDRESEGSGSVLRPLGRQRPHVYRSRPLGTAEFSQPAHVQLALDAAGQVAVVWDDGTKQVPQIVLRTSHNGGRSFGPRVAVSTKGRWAGFPVLALRTGTISIAWSEESAEAAVRAAQAMPNMKDPKAVMGLKAVGTAQVLVRRGTISCDGCFIAGFVLLAMACGKTDDFHPLKVGDAAPAYAAVTVSGDTLSLSEMRGHAVLINTWATWCPPCSAEMPGFQQLFAMFADSGLLVLGVSIDQAGADSKIREFVSHHALRFTIARDPEQRISRSFGAIGVPETLLLDRDGILIERWTGQIDPMSAGVIAKVREALRRAPLSAAS